MAGKLDHLKIKKAPACFVSWARNFNSQVDLLASIEGGPGIDVKIAHSERSVVKPAASSHRPKEQPRGKILFTLRPSAVNGVGVGGGGGFVPTDTRPVVGSDGLLIEVLVPNTIPTPNVYPSQLQVGTNAGAHWVATISGAEFISGAVSTVQNANGFGVTDTATQTEMRVDAFRAIDASNISELTPYALTITDGADTVSANSNAISVTDGATEACVLVDAVRVLNNGVFSEMRPNAVAMTDGGNFWTVNSSGFAMTDGTNAVAIPFASILRNMGIREFTGCNSGSPANYLTIASDFY